MSAPTTNKPAKRPIRGSFVALSFLPLAIMLVLNALATAPAMIVGGLEARNSSEAVDISSAADLLKSPAAQTALTFGFVGYGIIASVIFFLWYKKVFLKHQIKISNKEVFTPKRIALTVVLILGSSGAISLFLYALDALAPSLMESYAEMLEGVGLGSNFLTTLLYGCILAPIAEELMFRAVSQGYLRRAGLNAVAVVAIQAILFGIAHMNPIQSTYTTLFGLSLGLLRYKYGNVRITCFAHIVFNVYGTFGSQAIGALNLPDAGRIAFNAVLAAAGIVAAIMISKEPVKDIDLYKTPAPAAAPAVAAEESAT